MSKCDHDYRFLYEEKPHWVRPSSFFYPWVEGPMESAKWEPGFEKYKCIKCPHIKKLPLGKKEGD